MKTNSRILIRAFGKVTFKAQDYSNSVANKLSFKISTD